jgi:hypothetical protein
MRRTSDCVPARPYREDGRAFQDVAMRQTDTVSVTGLAEPEEAGCVRGHVGRAPFRCRSGLLKQPDGHETTAFT